MERIEGFKGDFEGRLGDFGGFRLGLRCGEGGDCVGEGMGVVLGRKMGKRNGWR